MLKTNPGVLRINESEFGVSEETPERRVKEGSSQLFEIVRGNSRVNKRKGRRRDRGMENGSICITGELYRKGDQAEGNDINCFTIVP